MSGSYEKNKRKLLAEFVANSTRWYRSFVFYAIKADFSKVTTKVTWFNIWIRSSPIMSFSKSIFLAWWEIHAKINDPWTSDFFLDSWFHVIEPNILIEYIISRVYISLWCSDTNFYVSCKSPFFLFNFILTGFIAFARRIGCLDARCYVTRLKNAFTRRFLIALLNYNAVHWRWKRSKTNDAS